MGTTDPRKILDTHRGGTPTLRMMLDTNILARSQAVGKPELERERDVGTPLQALVLIKSLQEKELLVVRK